MTDSISVTFGRIAIGPVSTSFFHEGINATVGNVRTVVQAGPSIPFDKVDKYQALKQAISGLGEPFGTIESKDPQGVAPGSEQTTLPSATVINGPNLTDLNSIH